MKISQADKYFSLCVREQAKHTCERCGKVGRMETSHVFSRRHRTIRWDKLNANCLCNHCHRVWHESPLESFKWFEEEFGQGRIDILIEKKNSKLKVPKSEEADIAKHYRNEFKKLEQDPDYEFVSWQ